MCEPSAEPSLLELCRGEAINRINSNLCANREQSPLDLWSLVPEGAQEARLSNAEAKPEIG